MREVLIAISHFKRFYSQTFQPLTEKFQLSQLETDVLLFFRNNPEYNTARDIVSMRGFAKSNVSMAVDSLRRKGFLTIQTDTNSRKLQRLNISPSAYAIAEELSDCQTRCFSRIMNGFSKEERQMLREQLMRIDQNILAALNSSFKEIN